MAKKTNTKIRVKVLRKPYETAIGQLERPIDRFFAYMRERQEIFQRRLNGAKAPFTDDEILRTYKFCCVFREDDRTTYWFKERIREAIKDEPEVFLATVVFRWFNRITTGSLIFDGQSLIEDRTPWSWFLETGDVSYIEKGLREEAPKGPWVTGAYLITSPIGMDKLAGVCRNIDVFNRWERDFFGVDCGWRDLAQLMLGHPGEIALEDVWRWLKKIPYQGPFLSYEIVTDLRHTALLNKAPDIMTWANPGPGAKRGLNRLHGREFRNYLNAEHAIEEMRALLIESGNNNNWPLDYPPLEMRDIEHNLCEFDKYERTRLGQGRPKGTFSPIYPRIIL